MASELMMSEAIVKAVAEAMKAAIQAMVAATGEWMQSKVGPKIGGPVTKQLTFNWEAEDKYN